MDTQVSIPTIWLVLPMILAVCAAWWWTCWKLLTMLDGKMQKWLVGHLSRKFDISREEAQAYVDEAWRKREIR